MKRKHSVLPRDVKVYAFIESYIRYHGFSPTYEEIGKEIKTQKQNITRTIKRLETMGCISRTPNATRGITPLKSPMSLA